MKRIVLNLPRRELVVCFEDTRRMKISIILAMEASNLLLNGWKMYTKKVSLALKEILIMNEFPKELKGLPL